MKAFPTNGNFTEEHNGMDLRDWFAGMAMQGIISRDNRKFDLYDVPLCYQVADEMMKVREK